MTRVSSLGIPLMRRAAVALFAALCVLGAQVDLLLPNQDDGDGGASAQVVIHDADLTPPAKMPTQAPPHTAHVDHCGHAHVFAPGPLMNTSNEFADLAGVPESTSLRLASISPVPHRRPPIA